MTRLLVLASLLLACPVVASPSPIDFDTARGAREVAKAHIDLEARKTTGSTVLLP